ncbi:MAG: hypothetical protein ACUVRR_08100 [Candidatus Fervidibacter sp.]|uniref:hypothetical protein n=1 Tax=Candidatus Fervidibacter sp. TaxID=3100871 RepID=UPI00404ADA45
MREGKTLEELLTEMVKDVGDITDLLPEAEQPVREKFQKIQQALEKLFTRKVKPPVPHVLIWLYLPKRLIHAIRQVERYFGSPYFNFQISSSEIAVRAYPPVWSVLEEDRVGILWDVSKQLMVLHRQDGTVVLRGNGLEVSGKIEVTWDNDGVHVRLANKMQKAKIGALGMLRKKGLYAVVLPVALLAAITQCFLTVYISLVYHFDAPPQPCAYPRWWIKGEVIVKTGPYELRVRGEFQDGELKAVTVDVVDPKTGKKLER